MKKILMFVNPNARQGALFIEEIKSWILDHGFELIDHSLDPKKEKISEVILRYAKEKPVVLVGGGDGSVNEALPGLMETGLPLWLIPLGTANNLARTLQIPNDLKDALAVILGQRITQVDVGMANQVPFVNVVGLGLSTQVNRLVRSESKRLFGVFAFMMTALKVALRMTPFYAKVKCDEQVHRALTWQITICNGRNYGSGLTIHEEASLHDGTLHGLSTEVKRWWHAFFLVPALITGRFKGKQDVTIFEGKKIHLKTHFPMRVDVDGDIKTKTPLEIEVRAKALNVFVPLNSENLSV